MKIVQYLDLIKWMFLCTLLIQFNSVIDLILMIQYLLRKY